MQLHGAITRPYKNQDDCIENDKDDKGRNWTKVNDEITNKSGKDV